MIISHRHEFIYLKARKVAGTSVEVSLAKHCGDTDIVPPVGAFDPDWDEDEYDHPGGPRPGYSRHSPLVAVRKRVGRPVWDTYFKFSIARNPWDLVVSQYHWATRADKRNLGASLSRFWRYPLNLRKNISAFAQTLARPLWKPEDMTFDFFVSHMLRFYPKNDRFYFDRSGSMELDFVIRYENLQDDYTAACERIGIPTSSLPSLKSKSRPERRHYSTYYDDRTRERVKKAYRRQIDQFDYSFEEP